MAEGSVTLGPEWAVDDRRQWNDWSIWNRPGFACRGDCWGFSELDSSKSLARRNMGLPFLAWCYRLLICRVQCTPCPWTPIWLAKWRRPQRPPVFPELS